MRVLMITALAVLTAGAVAAAPSLYGPEGLLVMPTASSLGLGQANAFVNYVDVDGGDLTVFGANAGVGMGLEVGIAHGESDGSDGATILNAKWNFMRETAMTPGVAVGAINLASEDDFSDSIEPYIVVSKQISLPETEYALTAHAGYWAGNADALMLGASLQVTPQLQILADYVDGYSDLSFGARYEAVKGLSLGAAAIDGDLALSASYSFGFN